MTEVLFDSVAERLAEMEAETPGNTLADVKVETPLSALGAPLDEGEPNTSGHTARCQRRGNSRFSG